MKQLLPQMCFVAKETWRARPMNRQRISHRWNFPIFFFLLLLQKGWWFPKCTLFELTMTSACASVPSERRREKGKKKRKKYIKAGRCSWKAIDRTFLLASLGGRRASWSRVIRNSSSHPQNHPSTFSFSFFFYIYIYIYTP